MATWTLDAYDRTGTSLVKAALPFRVLTARWVLNGPGSLEADFALYADLGSTAVGKHELKLRRDGTVIWAGPLTEADVDPDARTVKLIAEGLFSWLRSRVVRSDLLYQGVAQEQIAWNLIAHTQGLPNGDLGIVQGTHVGPSIQRRRFYCAHERPSIGEAIEAFTELEDGFDFEVDPQTRAFNTWTPQRKSATGIVLDGSKVDVMPYTISAVEMATYVTARGQGDCKPVLRDASDATLAATYGRREIRIDVDSEDGTELQAAANEELRARKRLRHDQTVFFRDGAPASPTWGSWAAGDTLTMSDSRGFATYTKTLRIAEWAVHLDNATPTVAMVEMVLSSAVD